MSDNSSTTSDYQVGLIVKPDGFASFLWQSSNLTIESDEYAAKDENGNTKVVTYRDHRVKISLEAVIPAGVAVPVNGSTVALKGIVLPTVSSSGTVTGDFKVDPTATTAVNFTVTGTPTINQSNTDYIKCSLECTRYLVNGLP